ncbi:hypothetical protein DYBT9275_02283 [Dyadobacter sp. CECT 9275]|uniref:Nucleotide-diphospho-sugar transferase n=1 Tax=Dyadobacter helix TaxID=2822344 RepID=A0A916NC50_9BACT|nr:nucleotide-diphospho-sugar transferase [Dyadobacter sp. CECT 9275]CAG4999702.1 hypothetical protein DYBT9275_02283 [Dyadobacter sp. CECT 9275]
MSDTCDFFDTPILFIVFNRIEETKIVFERIRRCKPINFFIAADGHRIDRDGERELCEAVRNWILSNIDWECTVKTMFNDQNLGCGRGPSQAISWFFTHVSEGIIIEDDCAPNDSFFVFCSDMLKRYRLDDRVSAISGNNFQPLQPMDIRENYYFSVFPSSWGWATWRRAWLGFDFGIGNWNDLNRRTILGFLFNELPYQVWWKNQFEWMYYNQPQDMWDFQFHFLSMSRRQLAIIPTVNLVSNIGHGSNGTHFRDDTSLLANIPTVEIEFPLEHPDLMRRNYKADVYVQRLLFGEVEQVGILRRLKRFVKRMISYKV